MEGISEVKGILEAAGITGWQECRGVFTWELEKVALYVRRYKRVQGFLRGHEESFRRRGWSVLTLWSNHLDTRLAKNTVQAVAICVGLGRVAL